MGTALGGDIGSLGGSRGRPRGVCPRGSVPGAGVSRRPCFLPGAKVTSNKCPSLALFCLGTVSRTWPLTSSPTTLTLRRALFVLGVLSQVPSLLTPRRSKDLGQLPADSSVDLWSSGFFISRLGFARHLSGSRQRLSGLQHLNDITREAGRGGLSEDPWGLQSFSLKT